MNTLRTSPFKRNETITNETFVQHVYDLDMIKIYNDFSIALSHKEKISSEFKSNIFLENIRERISEYCDQHDLNFIYHINTGNLVINSEDPQYYYFLGLRLITCKEYELSRILEYQNNKYSSEKVPFINLLLFEITPVIEHNSHPKDKSNRLNLLDTWIKEQRREKKLIDEISKLASEKKAKVIEINKLAKVDDQDTRLAIPGVDSEEIRAFFSPLAANNNSNGKLFMTQDQVERFLEQNIKGFPKPEELRKLDVNMNQVQIYFVFAKFYNRYIKQNIKGGKKRIAVIIKDSFICFASTEYSTVYKNFNRTPNYQEYLFSDVLE